MFSPRPQKEFGEISVTCSTPLKSSVQHDTFEWAASPVSKILSPSLQRTSIGSTKVPALNSDCRQVLFEIESSDEELVLPSKRTWLVSEEKKQRNVVCSKQRDVTSNSKTKRISNPCLKHPRSQGYSMTKQSLHTTIAEISNLDDANTLDGLRLNTADSTHSSHKCILQNSAVDKKSESRKINKNISLSNRSVEDSILNMQSRSKSTNKDISLSNRSIEDSVLNKKSGSQRTNKEISLSNRSVKDSIVNKKSGSWRTNKDISLSNRSVEDSVIIEPQVRGSSSKQSTSSKNEVEPRKSTRSRAVPTEYWKGKAAKFLPAEIFQNIPANHSKVSKLRTPSSSTPRKQAAIKVLVQNQDNSTNMSIQSKKTSTAKNKITNKHAVTCSVFNEDGFESIAEFQHKVTMEVFGLSAGFYRLLPGAHTGQICCYEDSQLYTVVQNEITIEIDGIIKELQCFDQIHVMKGVSHELSNRSNDTGLVQYVNINSFTGGTRK